MDENFNIEKPLITVVTVTYNSSAYVRDAIESVLSQSYENIEYIIGDDCSTDSTWQIIQEYDDPRIRRYRNEHNLGEYPNRNKAIQLATGKYLLFIDGDDYIYSHALSFFLKWALANPDCALVIQKGYINDVIFPIKHSPLENFMDLYFGRNLLSSGFASDFFKTDVLKRIGGLSTAYISGDEEIRMRIALQYPVLFVFGNLTFARETPNQASSKLLNGVALAERMHFSRELLQRNLAGQVSKDILNAAIHGDEKMLCLVIVKNLVKLRFNVVREVIKKSDFKFKMIWSFFKHDEVKSGWTYSPENPKRSADAVDPFQKSLQKTTLH